MLNRNTDIIRVHNSDYANINTKNRFIQKMIEMSAEDAISFRLISSLVGQYEYVDQMKNTYWLRVPQSDNKEYGDDVQMTIFND